MKSINYLRFSVTCLIGLAWFVVMLGAYTRLTDAGLGCPDWPGCYGQMVLPSSADKLHQAQTVFPHIPIESRKAWTEMAHRYVAGLLGLSIVAIACFVCFFANKYSNRIPKTIPCALLTLLVFQAALGMWTVTLKLLPIVVMLHLLGGMLIFANLVYFRWQISDAKPINLPRWRRWLKLGIALLFCQIALGGWVSSNYAGIACLGFPQCNGYWWPKLTIAEGFHILSPVNANYQGGLLDASARVTIQFIHRLGAYVTAGYLIILSLVMYYSVQSRLIKRVMMGLLSLVVSQFLLGVLNVIYLLPLSIAVAHNGIAALLLATTLSAYYLTTAERVHVG